MPHAVKNDVELALRALADHTRLRILSLLEVDREICVCDLMRVLELPQPTVSRHLAYLRRATLVRGRREGRWMYYRLSEPKSKFRRALIDCITLARTELNILRTDRKAIGCCERPPAGGTECCG